MDRRRNISCEKERIEKKEKRKEAEVYAIVFWVNDMEVYPFLTEDGQLKLFDKLKEADQCAEWIEKGQIPLTNHSRDEKETIECRVICIEGVKE